MANRDLWIPAVIAAYNRPYARERLPGSLGEDVFRQEADLAISIDGGGDVTECT